jgi:hypothetical protein
MLGGSGYYARTMDAQIEATTEIQMDPLPGLVSSCKMGYDGFR